jgi:hypothetical protein
LSQGPSSGIVDKTFVELMIVLLFTAFIIYVVNAVKLFNDGKMEEALKEIVLVEDYSKDVLQLLAQLESIE